MHNLDFKWPARSDARRDACQRTHANCFLLYCWYGYRNGRLDLPLLLIESFREGLSSQMCVSSYDSGDKKVTLWQAVNSATCILCFLALDRQHKFCEITASLAEWLRRPPPGRKIRGSISACTMGIFPGRVIPVTSKLALQWLPYKAPGVIGSVLVLSARCQYTVTG